MSKEPTLVVFTCESCHQAVQADASSEQIPLETFGNCHFCGGEAWTVTVVFGHGDASVELAATEAAVATMPDTESATRADSPHRADYSHVSAAVVARLNEQPQQRMERVAEFAQEMEREEIQKRGGSHCRSCGTLFVPMPGRPWSEKGYCTKLCFVKAEGPAAMGDDSGHPTRSSIEVECEAGHRFHVQSIFSGMLRPCPICGVKTRVP